MICQQNVRGGLSGFGMGFHQQYRPILQNKVLPPIFKSLCFLALGKENLVIHLLLAQSYIYFLDEFAQI